VNAHEIARQLFTRQNLQGATVWHYSLCTVLDVHDGDTLAVSISIDGVVYLGGQNINQLLVDQGWAVPWDGRGPQPLPPWPRQVAS
jgi:endonuclease YncB( thermonuclease family)